MVCKAIYQLTGLNLCPNFIGMEWAEFAGSHCILAFPTPLRVGSSGAVLNSAAGGELDVAGRTGCDDGNVCRPLGREALHLMDTGANSLPGRGCGGNGTVAELEPDSGGAQIGNAHGVGIAVLSWWAGKVR